MYQRILAMVLLFVRLFIYSFVPPALRWRVILAHRALNVVVLQGSKFIEICAQPVLTATLVHASTHPCIHTYIHTCIHTYIHSSQGVVDFRPSFQHFDPNGTGEISRRDFQAGLMALNWDLTEEELRAVMDEFDTDGDGYIQYDEFVDFVCGGDQNSAVPVMTKGSSAGAPGQQQLSDAARNVVLQVVQALEQRQADGQFGPSGNGDGGVNSAELFAPLEEYDTRKKGRVTVNDFETALIEMGVVGLTASAIRTLLQAFAHPKVDGFVDIAAFRRVVQRELLLPGANTLSPRSMQLRRQRNQG
jgi:hypothetical protein